LDRYSKVAYAFMVTFSILGLVILVSAFAFHKPLVY